MHFIKAGVLRIKISLGVLKILIFRPWIKTLLLFWLVSFLGQMTDEKLNRTPSLIFLYGVVFVQIKPSVNHSNLALEMKRFEISGKSYLKRTRRMTSFFSSIWSFEALEKRLEIAVSAQKSFHITIISSLAIKILYCQHYRNAIRLPLSTSTKPRPIRNSRPLFQTFSF